MGKIILIVLALCISCTTNKVRLPASDTQLASGPLIDKIEKKYEKEIADFQILVEEALVWRAKSAEFFEENEKFFKQKNQLPHKALLQIMESENQYLLIREKFLEIIERNRYHEEVTFQFSPGSKTEIKESGGYDYITGKDGFKYSIRLDPLDDEGKEILLRMKLGFAASTMLYDNYMVGIYPYEKHRKTRRLLNWDSPEHRRVLEKITDSFFNLKNRLDFLNVLRLFQKSEEFAEQNKNVAITENQKYFSELIGQSSVYQFMNTGKKLGKQPNILLAFANRIYDSGRFLVDSFSYFASKTFGNTMGLVASRKGKLKSLSEEEKKGITDQLQPLDIFLEKTPFRLTDKFIPGYYGHVAIWVGSKEQLKNLGVWDDPIIAKYHDKIEKGRFIIEALRPGVQLNSLNHFLNIDDLLVLRDKGLTDVQRREFIVRAFSQIGKDYDFNFDVETNNKIVCSEIVYVVFHDISWPTSKTLGRFTISPDHVVAKAINNGPLEPILMYKAGVRENGNLEEILKDMIK